MTCSASLIRCTHSSCEFFKFKVRRLAFLLYGCSIQPFCVLSVPQRDRKIVVLAHSRPQLKLSHIQVRKSPAVAETDPPGADVVAETSDLNSSAHVALVTFVERSMGGEIDRARRIVDFRVRNEGTGCSPRGREGIFA